MRSSFKCWAGVLLVSLVAGCGGSLFKTAIPASQTYQLTPLAADAPAVAPFDALLLVGLPVVAPGLDSERIAVLHPDRRLDYFAGSQWGAPVPEVVQNIVVASLQNTGRMRGVQRDLANFRPDFVLQLDVRAFQAEYAGDGAPQVRVDIIATIGRLNDRRSMLSIPAVAVEQADANTLTAVTAAFDKALQSAVRTLLASVIDYVDRTKGPTAAPLKSSGTSE
jgi:cholesterol transport system auxiliary component